MQVIESKFCNPKVGQIVLKNFIIHYHNLDALKQITDEVFEELPYDFYTDSEVPLIIDAGSNIGIATLFFKKRYPNARVLCFEPDPNSFEALKLNISMNSIAGVRLVNSALSMKEGEIDFFGQVSVDSPDSRGNSIIKTWGIQRKVNDTLKVDSVRLSSYINCDIDFLKLDIEGAEQQVLEDLERTSKLQFIKKAVIECHECLGMEAFNNLDRILEILERNNFSIEITEKDTKSDLPFQIFKWVEKKEPKLFIIKASQSQL